MPCFLVTWGIGSYAKLHGILPFQVGRAHPQALIYPITLAANSTNEARKDAALTIMADMRTHSPLVRESLFVF